MNVPGFVQVACLGEGCDSRPYVDERGPRKPVLCNLCMKKEPKLMSKKKNGKKDFSKAIAASAEGPPRERKEIKRYTDELPVRIDDASVATLADKLAEWLATRDSVEEQKKAAASGFKERLDELDALISSTAAAVRSKTEQRPVEVREYLNPDNSIDVVRSDTGEFLEKRSAEVEDLQPELFRDGGDTEPPAPVEGDTSELAAEQGGAQ